MAIEPVGPVVVGVDGSPASMAALDLAADEAAARVTPLLIVFAGPPETADNGPRPRMILDAAVSEALAEHPGLSVTGQRMAGDPATVLLTALQDAVLGVVGHRRVRAARDRGGDSSVVGRVLDQARVPVIVHRSLDVEVSDDLPRPVLVGVGVGEAEDDVVGFAFAEAALRGAPLRALHVGEDPADSDADHKLLAEALAVWSEKYPEVVVSQTVRSGVDAAVALTAASHAAQLLVVGIPRRSTRPATAYRATVYPGSVVSAVIQRAGCPVAVVPPTAGDPM